jgi:hypothetical protein
VKHCTRRKLFIIADKARSGGEDVKMGVGVVRDEELKLEDGEVVHTLGGAGEGGTKEMEVNRRREVRRF